MRLLPESRNCSAIMEINYMPTQYSEHFGIELSRSSNHSVGKQRFCCFTFFQLTSAFPILAMMRGLACSTHTQLLATIP